MFSSTIDEYNALANIIHDTHETDELPQFAFYFNDEIFRPNEESDNLDKLKAKIPVNAVQGRYSILQDAVFYNHLYLVKYLISAGADVNCRQNNGISCITLARPDAIQMIQFLLASDAVVFKPCVADCSKTRRGCELLLSAYLEQRNRYIRTLEVIANKFFLGPEAVGYLLQQVEDKRVTG